MQEPQGLLSRKNENKHIVVSLNYALLLLVMSDNKSLALCKFTIFSFARLLAYGKHFEP